MTELEVWPEGKHVKVTSQAGGIATAVGRCDPFSTKSIDNLLRQVREGFPDEDLTDLVVRIRQAGALPRIDQATPCAFRDPEPADSTVNGDDLAKEIERLLAQHVVLPESGRVATVLWDLHTFCYELFQHSPRLLITGPEKRCGKSLLLRVVASLASRPLKCGSITPAALFRSIDAWHPTLLLDEADNYLRGKHVNSELISVMNEGYERTGCVLRCEGDDHVPTSFPAFAPMAVAMIGKPIGTIEDRSIIVQMQRKSSEEKVARLPAGRDLRGMHELIVRKCIRWVRDSKDRLIREPEVPGELDDRAADHWYPLLAIADALGNDWPERARTAAVESQRNRAEDTTASVLVLSDVRELFSNRCTQKIPTAELLRHLIELEERPWSEFNNGRPLNAHGLARLLGPLGVKSTCLKVGPGNKVLRGYLARDLADPCNRYLP
ncbi:MAG: DUF3631 domain-containing protein [Planctomycetota bacterium]